MTSAKGPRLELVSAADPTRALAAASPMNVTADYAEFPPGRYSLQVFAAGDRQTALKVLDVPLKDGTYVTVLAHASATAAAAPTPAPGASPGAATPAASPTAPPTATAADIAVELIDDTPDPAKPDNQLTIRQYVAGARVIVATATKQTTDTLNYGGAQTLSGLPNGVTPLVTRASTPLGASTYNTEADFSTNWRSTLLIVNDPYGRFRPRMTMDGPPKPTPTPKPPR